MKQQTPSPHVADDSGRGAFGIPVKILRQGFVDRGRGLSLILTPFSGAMDGYRGCGHGWVEFGPDGTPLSMRYADDPDDDGEEDQNVGLSGSAGLKAPVVLPNGNTRLFGNFSCCSFCLF